nr:hypothetical protein [Micromonospora sp. DSM 115978]
MTPTYRADDEPVTVAADVSALQNGPTPTGSVTIFVDGVERAVVQLGPGYGTGHGRATWATVYPPGIY